MSNKTDKIIEDYFDDMFDNTLTKKKPFLTKEIDQSLETKLLSMWKNKRISKRLKNYLFDRLKCENNDTFDSVVKDILINPEVISVYEEYLIKLEEITALDPTFKSKKQRKLVYRLSSEFEGKMYHFWETEDRVILMFKQIEEIVKKNRAYNVRDSYDKWLKHTFLGGDLLRDHK